MTDKIEGKKVAILATHGFEQTELTEPQRALREAGAEVHVVSPERGPLQAFSHFDKSIEVDVDRTLDQVQASDYDALVIPGGLFNPDQLRVDEAALRFTKAFFAEGKPVGAICHGPWLLVNADVARGRELTSVKTIRKDLENAGAHWVDRQVVVDQGLVTSRTPDDLPAFCAHLIEEIGEGRHPRQRRSAA